jgi:thioesterase domain-containing protein
VLTGWGATWLALRERGLGGLIVVADSTIQYRTAVTGEILCRCNTEPGAIDASLERYVTSGRTRLSLVCTIDANDKPAVTFTGAYVVQAKHGK